MRALTYPCACALRYTRVRARVHVQPFHGSVYLYGLLKGFCSAPPICVTRERIALSTSAYDHVRLLADICAPVARSSCSSRGARRDVARADLVAQRERESLDAIRR